MGENSKDEKYEPVENVQPPIYGSEPEVSNHDEESSASESKITNEAYSQRVSNAATFKQPIRGNQQNQDIESRNDNTTESDMNEDDYEQGKFTSRSQLNEMEDGNLVSMVEGDDEDILGETENAERNRQRMRETGSNQGSSQDR